MKILFKNALWCLFVLITITSQAQSEIQSAANTSHTDAYICLSEKYLTLLNLRKQEQSIADIPFLAKISKDIKITTIQSSFYFTNDPQLLRTIRVSLTSQQALKSFIELVNVYKGKEIDYAEPVPLFFTESTPNDLPTVASGNAWALYKIQAQQAWDITTGNPNIVVAVVDNGFQMDHPDLATKYINGRDVANGDNSPQHTDPTYSHGTHVAGIVGAATNNGTGIASIGYNIKVMPIKATTDGAGNMAITHGYEGLAWAGTQGAKVINASWGGGYAGVTGQNVINSLYNNGSIVVAAAGNNGNANLKYPAAYTNVIAVAATDIADAKSSFSNYGSWIDIAAPGSNIYSTFTNSGYHSQGGTSMASPMVAGLLGLMWSANPTLSQTQLINCLTSTAEPTTNYIGQLGAGRINAYRAVLCAANISNDCPDLIVTGSLNTLPSGYNGKTVKTTGQTEVAMWQTVKFDAEPSLGCIEIIPTTDSDYFFASGGIGFSSVFIAQTVDACGPLSPQRTPSAMENNLVEKNIPNTTLTLFPNPTTGLITIQGLEAIKTLTLFDLTGKQLQQIPTNESTTLEINLSNYPAGVYFVKTDSGKTQKVIKH